MRRSRALCGPDGVGEVQLGVQVGRPGCPEGRVVLEWRGGWGSGVQILDERVGSPLSQGPLRDRVSSRDSA